MKMWRQPGAIQERMDDIDQARSLFLQMRLRFLENRFTDAMNLNALRNVEDSTLLDRWQNFEALVQSVGATQNHKRVPMLDGQVIVHVEPVSMRSSFYTLRSDRQRGSLCKLDGVAPYPDPLHSYLRENQTLAAGICSKPSEIQNPEPSHCASTTVSCSRLRGTCSSDTTG